MPVDAFGHPVALIYAADLTTLLLILIALWLPLLKEWFYNWHSKSQLLNNFVCKAMDWLCCYSSSSDVQYVSMQSISFSVFRPVEQKWEGILLCVPILERGREVNIVYQVDTDWGPSYIDSADIHTTILAAALRVEGAPWEVEFWRECSTRNAFRTSCKIDSLFQIDHRVIGVIRDSLSLPWFILKMEYLSV